MEDSSKHEPARIATRRAQIVGLRTDRGNTALAADIISRALYELDEYLKFPRDTVVQMHAAGWLEVRDAAQKQTLASIQKLVESGGYLRRRP